MTVRVRKYRVILLNSRDKAVTEEELWFYGSAPRKSIKARYENFGMKVLDVQPMGIGRYHVNDIPAFPRPEWCEEIKAEEASENE